MITSKALYLFLKLIGLCPFDLTEDGTVEISYGGACYATLLSFSYGVCYYRLLINRMDYELPNETLMSMIADMAAKSAQFWMIVITWLRLGYRQNVLAGINTSFRKIVETCKILGIDEVRSSKITSLKIQTVFVNCGWMALFLSINLLVWDIDSFESGVKIPFNLGRVVYPNFIILFIAIMSVIRDQFRSLNNKIKELSRDDPTRMTIRKAIRPKPSNTSRIETLGECDLLDAYVQVHSELVDLTKGVLAFCSTSLYLTMTIHLAELASTAYDICLNVKDQKVWSPQDNGYFIILIIWLTFHVITIVALVAVSDSSTKEANRTGNILHEILISNPSRNLVRSVDILSLRLLQRPLTIELFGTLQMDFSVVYQVSFLHTVLLDRDSDLLHEIITDLDFTALSCIRLLIGNVITTYIIIMMQLDDQRRERHRINKLPDPNAN